MKKASSTLRRPARGQRAVRRAGEPRRMDLAGCTRPTDHGSVARMQSGDALKSSRIAAGYGVSTL